MLNIGWFSTGKDPAAGKLFDVVQKSISSKYINGRIEFVFCNRGRGEHEETDGFLDLVREYNTPLVSYSIKKFATNAGIVNYGAKGELPQFRYDYDRTVMEKIRVFKPDICVLAGYMLIVSPELCLNLNMINLHPSLPSGPTGSWQEVIWELISQRASENGVMMHLVTPDLDRGPVITYCRFPIIGQSFQSHWREVEIKQLDHVKLREGENNHLFKMIREEGAKRELPLILETLKALSDGNITVKGGSVYNKLGETISGYDLSKKVESEICRPEKS